MHLDITYRRDTLYRFFGLEALSVGLSYLMIIIFGCLMVELTQYLGVSLNYEFYNLHLKWKRKIFFYFDSNFIISITYWFYILIKIEINFWLLKKMSSPFDKVQMQTHRQRLIRCFGNLIIASIFLIECLVEMIVKTQTPKRDKELIKSIFA